MASKNLTHIYMIMRDKAIQRRNMYTLDEGYTDQDSLVLNEQLEGGVGGRGSTHLPEWSGAVEEVQCIISTLEDKTKRLASLHSNLVRRPSLDDNTEEERQLNTMTNEIRRSLERCQSLMVQIQHTGSRGREEKLNRNVVRALAFSMTEVKNNFMRTCADYTSYLNSRTTTSSFIHDGAGDENHYGTFEASEQRREQWTQEQMLFLEDNTLMIEERDRGVQNVLKSTLELNQLFKDIGQLVLEQGSIMDRIDTNVEHSALKVESGVQQLRKAEGHQRKNRNMVCILVLAGLVILFILLIMIKKS